MRIFFVTESWDRENGPFETPYAYYCNFLTGTGHEVGVMDNKAMHLPIGGQSA